MKNRRHTPEQVIRKLAEADKLLAQGKTIEEVARHLEISEQTFHRWRNQYGGMKADDAKRLKELEKENQRLKKIVADQALDIDMLKELELGCPCQNPWVELRRSRTRDELLAPKIGNWTAFSICTSLCLLARNVQQIATHSALGTRTPEFGKWWRTNQLQLHRG
jgi:putative transposase